MHIGACWFGIELDFRADPTGVSFYLGASTVDDEPELDPRGDVVGTFIGFAPTPHPGWEICPNGYDEPAEGDEDT